VGANDVVRRYVFITNRHDSLGSLTVATSPTRPVCGNTVRWGLENAFSTWTTAHTSGITNRVAEARRTLKLTNRYYDAFADDARELYRTPMSDAEFDRFLSQVVFKDADEDAPEYVKARVDRKRAEARRLFREAPTNANIRNTRWGAGQALVEQIDHGAGVRVPKSLLLDEATPKSLREDIARGARVVKGDDDERKTVIHKALLTWGR
jgi:phage/plasmid-like protein (TIGR03299 family)